MHSGKPTFATCAYSQMTIDLGTPVQASLGRPKFPLRYELQISNSLVTPDYWFLKKPKPEYEQHFLAKLDAAGPEKILKSFERVWELTGALPVILCFEDLSRPGYWCHRTMVADWWLSRTGEAIPELGAVPFVEPWKQDDLF